MICACRYVATGAIAATTMTKISVRMERSAVSAISFGVFCRLAPSTRWMMRSRNELPGSAETRTSSQSEMMVVPAVTDENMSVPGSFKTGADSPVMAASLT